MKDGDMLKLLLKKSWREDSSVMFTHPALGRVD